MQRFGFDFEYLLFQVADYSPINTLHSPNQHLFLSFLSSALVVTYQTCQLDHSQLQIRRLKRLYQQLEDFISLWLLAILLQSISFDLEIIVTFLQILASSPNRTMWSFSLTCVTLGCFLKCLVYSYFTGANFSTVLSGCKSLFIIWL